MYMREKGTISVERKKTQGALKCAPCVLHIDVPKLHESFSVVEIKLPLNSKLVRYLAVEFAP